MPINEIQKDSSNLRNNVDPAHVASIKQKILSGRFPDPPKVRYENGQYYCFDGMHRLTAFRELGYSSLMVEIYQYDSRTAREESYEANLGRNWAEAEKANRFLTLYQEGLSPEEISKKYPNEGNEDTISKKIRFAYWADPNLLNLLGKGISQKLIGIFIRYEKAHQVSIYNTLQVNRWDFVEVNIQWVANRDNYPQFKRIITQIPRQTVQSTPVVVPAAPKVDPLQEYIEHLKNYIKGLSLQYGVPESQILDRLG